MYDRNPPKLELPTVTPQLVDTLLPSFAVQVMIVAPAAMPLTRPVLSTVATFTSLDFQVTVLLIASLGATVALSAVVWAIASLTPAAFNVIDVTGLPTVTAHVALIKIMDFEVQVIVALPTPTAL
jgi:hypothetical protein